MSESKLFFYFKKTWWILLLFILFILHSYHGLSSDEGLILNGAWQIIQGKKLYVDFFEYHSPGAFYLLAGWWKIFPVSYLTAKVLFLLIVFFTSVGLWILGQQLKLKEWSWLPPLFYVLSSVFWDIINHNSASMFFLVWSVVTFIFILKKNRPYIYYIIVGLLMGITLIFLQHKGLVIIGTNLLFSLGLLWKKNITLKHYLLYFLGIIIPLLFIFIFWKPLDLFSNLILFPAQNYTAVNVVSLNSWVIILLITLALSLFSYFKSGNKKIILYFLILQVFLLLSVLQRADIRHLSQNIFPLFFLLSINLELIKFSIKIRGLLVSGICLGSVIFMYIFFPGSFFGKPSQDFYNYIYQICPEDSFYAGPFLPGMYFEFKKNNQLPYSFLLTNHHTTEQFNQSAASLSANPPQCALLNYDMVKKFSYNKDNPVDRFFLENYFFVKNIAPGLNLYKLK